MSEYYTRVEMWQTSEADPVECWEHVVDDKVVGYVADNQSAICEYSPAVSVRYISRQEIADPWAAA